MDDSEFIGRVAALCEKWNLAEEGLKLAENINRGVAVPAINELRYAGRKIVDAFAAYQERDESTATEYLADANRDILRAHYDSADAIHTFIADYACKVRDKLSPGVLHERFANYGEMFRLIRTIEQKIEESRGQRRDRNKFYAEIHSDIPRLIELHYELQECLPAIEDGESARQDKSRRNFRRNTTVMILIAVIGAVMGAVITGMFF